MHDYVHLNAPIDYCVELPFFPERVRYPTQLHEGRLSRELKNCNEISVDQAVFVLPELSSGRNLVIQMSVRRSSSATAPPEFFVRSISREPYALP